MLLLQIEQAYTSGLMTRLADQLFTVVLLVGFALYSVSKQKKIEEKLDKYLEEDREKMISVIENNTRAFDRIANKLSLLLVGLFLTFCSCHTVKKTSTSVYRQSADTSASIQRATSNTTITRDRETKDTVIKVPTRELTDTIKAADLSPLYTADGTAVPNVKTIPGKGISARVTALPSGDLVINCRADSLQLVIQSLTREKEQIWQYDSVEQVKYQKVQQALIVEQSKLKTKIVSFWYILAGAFAIFMGILILIFRAVKKGVFHA